MEVKFSSRTETDTNPVQKASIEDKKNFYAVRKLVRHEKQSTGTCYTTRRYGYKPQDYMSSTIEHILHHFRVAYWRRLQKRQQKPKSTMIQSRPRGKASAPEEQKLK